MILTPVSYLFVLAYFFRFFSRNIYKRQQENQKFLQIFNRVKNYFKYLKMKFTERDGVKSCSGAPNATRSSGFPRGEERSRSPVLNAGLNLSGGLEPMFGYVTANKPELKMREFGRYKAFYCGLCRRLGKTNGAVSRLTLSYDMTFLILLLSSLYEPEEQQERHRCLIHPGKKQWMIYNPITDYASDMNVLLSCYHFQDDWEDERSIVGLCGAKVFAGRAKKIAGQYPRQAEAIRKQLGRLAELEQKESQNRMPSAVLSGNCWQSCLCTGRMHFRIYCAVLDFTWESIFTC